MGRLKWENVGQVAAMFKIWNSKELPVIPDVLSKEGKDFVRLCLQRNPAHRPSAAQLLEHPFVEDAPRVSGPDVHGSSSDLLSFAATRIQSLVCNFVTCLKMLFQGCFVYQLLVWSGSSSKILTAVNVLWLVVECDSKSWAQTKLIPWCWRSCLTCAREGSAVTHKVWSALYHLI